jgi:hypothetical protein
LKSIEVFEPIIARAAFWQDSRVVFFEIVGELSEAETFAIGKSIRELPRLRKLNGKGRRRKQKGLAGVRLPNGTMRKALGGSAMTSRRMKTKEFAVCIRNAGFGASLEVSPKFFGLFSISIGAAIG